MSKHFICVVLVLTFSATTAAAACKTSDLGGLWQAIINFPGVAISSGPGFGFVLSCGLRVSITGQIRAVSSCIELTSGFDGAEDTEFRPGRGRLQVSRACGVTGTWGSNQIMGTLGAGKATVIGAIEWEDGDIATFTAIRPGK